MPFLNEVATIVGARYLLRCAATSVDLRRAASGGAIPLWRELFVEHFGRSGYEEAVGRARAHALGSEMLDERRLYAAAVRKAAADKILACLLYTSPSPRDS